MRHPQPRAVRRVHWLCRIGGLESAKGAGETEVVLALCCESHPDTNSSWAALDWTRGGGEAASFCFTGGLCGGKGEAVGPS